MPTYIRGRAVRTLSDEAIVRRYGAGESSTDVAIAAHCTAEVVLYLVRRAGHPVRPRGAGARKPLPLTDAEIVKLYTVEGLSGPTLADRCQTTTATIYARLRRAGVTLRAPGDVLKGKAAAAQARAKRTPG